MNKINMEHGQIKRRKMRFWAFLLAVLVLTTSMSPALVMAAEKTHAGGMYSLDLDPNYGTSTYIREITESEIQASKIDFDNDSRDPAHNNPVKVFYYDIDAKISDTFNTYYNNADGAKFMVNDRYRETTFSDGTVFLTGTELKSGDSFSGVPGETPTLQLRDYETISNKSKDDIHFAKWQGIEVVESGDVTSIYLFPQEVESNALEYLNVKPEEHENPERFYHGYKVELTPAERDGYFFEGWYTEANFVNKVTEIPAEGIAGIDYMFYAKWSEACTVTFDSDGGTAVDPQKLRKNEKAEKPDNPKKEGYTFKGWFLNDEEYDFNTPVTANITLKAKWEKNEEGGGGEGGEGGEGGGGSSKGSGASIPFDTTGRLLQVVVTKRTDTSLTISWNQITGADGYRIYGHKCYSHNVDFIKDVTDLNNLTFTWENLEKDSYYKFVVKAYKKVGRRKKNIAKSIRVHATTTSDTYTVAKTVEIESVDGGEFSAVSGNSLIMSKGKSATITAKEVLEDSSKTIEEKHRSKSKKVTWLSNDLEVVKISKKGKIKAVAPGECIIYGTAQNGVFVPVKVTVK